MMKTEPKKPELPFPSEKFAQIWEEWLTFRKEQKFPAYKPTGLRRTLSGLERDSGGNEETAIAIIIYSMEKTWQGLFPLKTTNGTATHQQTFTNNPVKIGVSVARTDAASKF